MKILCNDIGTGTQDILYFDSRLDVENGYKLILPSPTMMIHRRLASAAFRRESVALTGVMMGGGPSSWGVEGVLKSGAKVFATPDAARTINDDLDKVREMGIILVSEDELLSLPDTVNRIEFKDFDFDAIRETFSRFGVSLDDLSAVAIAVFDHGNAPPQISDRQFRFDYLDERIKVKNSLCTFAFTRDKIPESMTRLQAVASSARNTPGELIVMDTAAAAIAGALMDERVKGIREKIIANIGNFHTLAFRMTGTRIDGVFEHHTGLLTPQKLDAYLGAMMDGTLDHRSVFEDHGHGSLLYVTHKMELPDPGFDLVVTGPRRAFMKPSRFRSYYPAPFGDMMICGCFGLLSATADLIPEFYEEIIQSLSGIHRNTAAPWEVDNLVSTDHVGHSHG
jgi:uncharacterized protein (DUF1786 family)